MKPLTTPVERKLDEILRLLDPQTPAIPDADWIRKAPLSVGQRYMAALPIVRDSSIYVALFVDVIAPNRVQITWEVDGFRSRPFEFTLQSP